MRVLVVDDDAVSPTVLEDTLSRYGKVSACADGSEAVGAARLALDRGEPYHLICMDISMPVMNGLDALQLLREYEAQAANNTRAKVIVITGTEDSVTINEAFSRLCDAYIVKPIDTEELLGIVGVLLSD